MTAATFRHTILSMFSVVDTVPDTAKAAPPVAVSVASFAGMPLDTWIQIITAVYLVLLVVYQAIKLWDRFSHHGEPAE